MEEPHVRNFVAVLIDVLFANESYVVVIAHGAINAFTGFAQTIRHRALNAWKHTNLQIASHTSNRSTPTCSIEEYAHMLTPQISERTELQFVERPSQTASCLCVSRV